MIATSRATPGIAPRTQDRNVVQGDFYHRSRRRSYSGRSAEDPLVTNMAPRATTPDTRSRCQVALLPQTGRPANQGRIVTRSVFGYVPAAMSSEDRGRSDRTSDRRTLRDRVVDSL